MDRIIDAFAWPLKDPDWLTKLLIVALTLLIPIVGAINGLGWMLACLERLRAGEERLAPANLRYIGRGFPLFVVNFVYILGVAVAAGLIYVPALIVAANQSQGQANPALLSLAVLLSLLAFSVAALGSRALYFAVPSIVPATDPGPIPGGLQGHPVLQPAHPHLP